MADLTEEARAAIAEAARILREDGVHIHKSYAAFQKSQEAEKTDETEGTEGKAPPVKDPPTTDTAPKRKGIGLWGKE